MKKLLLLTLLTVALVVAGCKTVYVTETLTTTQTTTERITETTTVINERNMLETLAYPCVVYSDVYVSTLGYYLMNNGTQAITLHKMEVVNAGGVVFHTVIGIVITEQCADGVIKPGAGFEGINEFEEPYIPMEDLLQWKAVWYCTDAIGDFVVETPFTNPWVDWEDEE
jgi:hypothetical protein